MPKLSRETAEVDDLGIAEDRHGEVGDYTVDFTTIRQDMDLAPLLKGLPDDSCQCPHWGYMIKGKIVARYGDHEEVYETGDAFYLAPGHIPMAEAGSEFVQFSPTSELAALLEHMQENMRKLEGAA